jgi:NAD(P)-dependent dehydrogenase (short-subunit alcohol dehydrogenase family)
MNTSKQKNLLNYVPQSNILEGRIILVTGASDGIGRAVAKAYAQFGATVVLLSKTIKKLEKVYDEIVDAGYPEPAIYPMHLEGAVAKDYENLANTLNEKLGGLDAIVLNAASLPAYTPLKHYDIEMWSKVITTNLHANFLILRHCLPLLEAAKDPAIVFSSHFSERAYNGAFGVAKSGADALLKIVADEYDDKPFIRVNGIDTGPVRTRLRTFHYPGENPATLASPDAVVGAYLYYVSPDAKRTTGEIIRFDTLPADSIWIGNKATDH